MVCPVANEHAVVRVKRDRPRTEELIVSFTALSKDQQGSRSRFIQDLDLVRILAAQHNVVMMIHSDSLHSIQRLTLLPVLCGEVLALVVKDLDSVVSSVSDDDLVLLVDHDASGFVELAFVSSLGPKLQQEVSLPIKHLHLMPTVFTNDDVVVKINCDSIGSIKCWFVPRSDGEDMSALGIKLLDSVVAVITDDDVVLLIDSNACWVVELAIVGSS